MTDLDGVRVALVLATSAGGVGRHVRSLARGLPAYGAAVTVLGPAATLDRFDLAATGARLHPVEIASGPRPVRDARALGRLRRALPGADVVHAHGLRAGLLAGLGRPPGTALAVTLHNAVLGGGPARAAYAVAERLVVRRADVVLAVSADLARRARRLGGRDVRLTAVAAPQLGPPARRPAEVRAALGAGTRPLVLAVGRLHPQKGFDVLVEAAARLAAAGDPLVVVAGDGPAGASLRASIAASGAPVELLGRREDVADLLAAADVVVLPSRWEGYPLAAQEALRAGRPLVASAVGGVPSLVGDAAVLVPPGDAAALAAAVSRLLTEPAAAAELARRGPTRAAGWPDEAGTVAAAAALYAELVGR